MVIRAGGSRAGATSRWVATEKLRTAVTSRMRRAYHADSALAAEAELCALAGELDRTHPGAAASLREGMAETLTVPRLGIRRSHVLTARPTPSSR